MNAKIIKHETIKEYYDPKKDVVIDEEKLTIRVGIITITATMNFSISKQQWEKTAKLSGWK